MFKKDINTISQNKISLQFGLLQIIVIEQEILQGIIYSNKFLILNSILELDEFLTQTYKLFDKAPDSVRGVPPDASTPTYFL